VSPSVYPPLGQGIVAFWWKQILFLAGGEGAQFRCVYTLHMRADVGFLKLYFHWLERPWVGILVSSTTAACVEEKVT